MKQKHLTRVVSGFEHFRTPESSVMRVDFVFGKTGNKVINIPGTMMKEIHIIENMRYLCDTVEFVFNDRMAMLPEFLPFNGNEKIIIECGQDIYKTQKSHFDGDKTGKLRYGVYDIFRSNYGNTDLVNPTKWHMKFFLINTLARPLFDETHCRTFKDMRISDIIRRLIEPCKSEYIDERDLRIEIEDTKIKGTFTQPMGWTNAQMINYLTELTGDYIFMIYGTTIMFKSISSMLKQKPIETIWVSHKDYNKTHSDQKHKIILDSNFSLNNYFFNTVGARGIALYGYNFDKKQKLTTYSTITKQKPLALGEKFPLAQGVISNRGRLKNTGLKDKSLLDEKANFDNITPFMNILSSFVLTVGRANRKPGNIIETVYRTAKNDEIFNDVYSGQWLINAITHTFRGEAKVYYQKMELKRNAFGKGAANLLKPDNIKKTSQTLDELERKMRGEGSNV